MFGEDLLMATKLKKQELMKQFTEGKKIGFIGAGNMATAIVKGLLKSKKPAGSIFVYDCNVRQLKPMAEMGVSIAYTGEELVEKSDIIVLAVKPQNYDEVLAEIKPAVTEEKIFVTNRRTSNYSRRNRKGL